jgi:hypothetical protein
MILILIQMVWGDWLGGGMLLVTDVYGYADMSELVRQR